MTLELTPAAQADLDELCRATGQPADALAGDAIARLHRTYIGLPDGDPDAPKIDTGPFRKRYSYQPAEIVLRQIDATRFDLEEPFQFVDGEGAPKWIVPASDVTDLASVPQFLTWLVPRYGRHTLAALLHDHLQDQPISSAAADLVFLRAMGDTGVPLVRRWVMWAAVSARTRKNAGGLSMVTVILWLLAYVVTGTFVLPFLAFAAVAGWVPAATFALVLGLVAVSPFVLSLVWVRGYRFASLSALAVLVIGYAALLVLVVYGVYVLLELVTRPFQRHPHPITAAALRAAQARAQAQGGPAR